MSELPDGLNKFVGNAGWAGAVVEPIPGDASFRRYFRLRRTDASGPATAMLMYARPPEEDPLPFLKVAAWLTEQGLRAPAIYAQDAAQGWVLTEDFGNDRMRDWLDLNPDGELAAYEAAVDALVELHLCPAGPFPDYDMPTYQREVRLLTEWYAPAAGLEVDESGFIRVWDDVLAPLTVSSARPVTVLRDYHAENIMLLGASATGLGAQGLIDFQDALAGHPAYDLVSLLQDARREVSLDLEQRMLARYAERTGFDARATDDFLADYARLGAQRNAKIIGIFTRLYKRDGKPRYLELIPRVWEAMERDLAHPALAPVARWFDENIPVELRNSGGGTIA